MAGPHTERERVKEKICEIFHRFSLKINIKTSLQVMDFLDVTSMKNVI